MLDLVSYHQQPLVAILSKSPAAESEQSQRMSVAMSRMSIAAPPIEENAKEKQEKRSFVKMLATILKENQ